MTATEQEPEDDYRQEVADAIREAFERSLPLKRGHYNNG
jgi:hypothetical protein